VTTNAPPRPSQKKLGLDQVEAGVAPKDKYARIERLRGDGSVVAMAGDGINDAPALAAADCGHSMGTGTDVAMESAGITLVKGDLNGIVQAIHLSRAVMRNIRQNLFFAFIYNVLGIPIAAGVFYPFFRAAPEPDHRRRGDEPQFGFGDCECFAIAAGPYLGGSSAPPLDVSGRDAFPRRPTSCCERSKIE